MAINLSRKTTKKERQAKPKKKIDIEIDGIKGNIEVEFPIEDEEQLSSVLLSLFSLPHAAEEHLRAEPASTKEKVVQEPKTAPRTDMPEIHTEAIAAQFDTHVTEPSLKHAPVTDMPKGDMGRELLLKECSRIRDIHAHLAEYVDRPKADPWNLADYNDRIEEVRAILALLAPVKDREIEMVHSVGRRLETLLVQKVKSLDKPGLIRRIFRRR